MLATAFIKAYHEALDVSDGKGYLRSRQVTCRAVGICTMHDSGAVHRTYCTWAS